MAHALLNAEDVRLERRVLPCHGHQLAHPHQGVRGELIPHHGQQGIEQWQVFRQVGEDRAGVVDTPERDRGDCLLLAGEVVREGAPGVARPLHDVRSDKPEQPALTGQLEGRLGQRLRRRLPLEVPQPTIHALSMTGPAQ